jgi:subtilisin family serine protease
MQFSNYGPVVDVQGWGAEVTTCGYGSLQGGRKELRWYTDQFGGTSSAAPIVAGVLACLQGIQKARGRPPLTPAQARQLLRDVGWDQTDGRDGKFPKTQRIGKRPDLSLLIPKLP